MASDGTKGQVAGSSGLAPDGGPWTYDVPEAGAMAGYSRNGSYEAVKQGVIPAFRAGRLLKVPGVAWRRKLSGEAA